MLRALLLGICSAMPFFDTPMTGPVCADQLAECRCSECIIFDPPSTGADGVDYYEIARTDPGGPTWISGRITVGVDREDGTRTMPPLVYCPARHDELMPLEGQTYSYAVRACNNVTGCSPYSDPPIWYTAAPYAIDHFRPPTQGN